MKKADARYIVDFHKWINDNMDVKSDDLEHYANCMMNSECLLTDVVNGVDECTIPALNLPVVIPRILHFTDENGNNTDVNAAGVNARLLRDGTFEYFISYGFAGRKELTPVYGV